VQDTVCYQSTSKYNDAIVADAGNKVGGGFHGWIASPTTTNTAIKKKKETKKKQQQPTHTYLNLN
jgi:hypothetical protein